MLPESWTLVSIHPSVVARLPKMTQGRIMGAAVRAKTKCLMSRLPRANVSMNAKLKK